MNPCLISVFLKGKKGKTMFMYLIIVKIQYAKIDNISIQFNFTTIAYTRSLKETQSQDRHRLILGNPLGEENPAKLPQYRWSNVQRQNPKQVLLLLADISLSLSPMRITQVSVSKWGAHHSYLYFIFHLTFSLTRSGPTNLTGSTYLGRLKTI